MHALASVKSVLARILSIGGDTSGREEGYRMTAPKVGLPSDHGISRTSERAPTPTAMSARDGRAKRHLVAGNLNRHARAVGLPVARSMPPTITSALAVAAGTNSKKPTGGAGNADHSRPSN